MTISVMPEIKTYGKKFKKSSQPMDSLGSIFKKRRAELRERESRQAELRERESRKNEMKSLFDTAVEELEIHLDQNSENDFLESLERKVYSGGSLDDYYKEVAKLDALKWLERHREEVLDLRLPSVIVLAIQYNLSAQPKILTKFHEDATRLLEPIKKPEKRDIEKPAQEVKRARKDNTGREPSGESASASDEDVLKKDVTKNGKIRKNDNLKGLKIGRRRAKTWVSEDGKTRKDFAVKKPEGEKGTIFSILEKSDNGKWAEPSEYNMELERVFGVIRIKQTKQRRPHYYYQNNDDLKKYLAAVDYWTKQVQKQANSTDKPSWSVNLNQKGVALKERAYYTPFIKTIEGQSVKITYVNKKGEVVSENFIMENAPVPEARFVTAEDILGED